jgi:hypothetical protein
VAPAAVAAPVAAVVLALLICFQLLLGAGLPLGRAAWGGRHRVLPRNLRWASLGAAGVLCLGVWIVLSWAGLVTTGAESSSVRLATRAFAGYLSLNTVGNLLSRSPVERSVMTPVSALLAVCFVVVALS